MKLHLSMEYSSTCIIVIIQMTYNIACINIIDLNT